VAFGGKPLLSLLLSSGHINFVQLMKPSEVKTDGRTDRRLECLMQVDTKS